MIIVCYLINYFNLKIDSTELGGRELFCRFSIMLYYQVLDCAICTCKTSCRIMKPDSHLINNKSTFKRKQCQACLGNAECSAFNKVKNNHYCPVKIIYFC